MSSSTPAAPAESITLDPDITAPEFSHHSERKPGSGFPILVALATDECVRSTVSVAEALVHERGAEATLLYVMELTPAAAADGGYAIVAMADELTNPEAHRRDEAELRKACHVDVGAPAGWPFEIEIGMPAARITSRARELGAQLIVMGLNRHSAISRVIGGHTVREVITTTDAPVLAVRPQLTTLPKSVVVAMDFGQASIRAAHLARRILDAHGTMHLVFVDVPVKPHASETEEAKEAIHARGVEAEFRELVEALDPGPGMTIASVECMGDPIAELQAACEQIEPDVVAMGRQRHSIFERLMVGSVTKAMVNDGRWSVLVMPPSATIATPPAANRPHLQY